MQYLLSGIPACRKTTFGDWAQERGWLHINMESWNGSAQHRLWEKCLAEASIEQFVRHMARAAPRVVYSWGFPIGCVHIIKQFKDAGVSIWWLSGDIDQARHAKLGRDGDLGAFETQVRDITNARSDLDALYGPNQIATLDAAGCYMDFLDVSKAIGLAIT